MRPLELTLKGFRSFAERAVIDWRGRRLVAGEGARHFQWLGDRHRRALAELRRRLTDRHPLVALPLVAHEPTDLASLAAFGHDFQDSLRQG